MDVGLLSGLAIGAVLGAAWGVAVERDRWERKRLDVNDALRRDRKGTRS